ncbi:MAG: ABC transporter ATP-binding protein [Candidatus Cloacimonetes bacterium]|nr:ABC transporter ATP-binding protein [Candidatus Cloacimonadota bacterium]
MNLMEIKNLTKLYGKFKALDDVNLEIPRGRIIGLLGKNGAGKSTLMRSMLGLLNFEGNIRYKNLQITHSNYRVFENIAFIPDVSGLDDRLTVKQTIDFVSAVNPAWLNTTAYNLLEKSNLPLKQKVGKLSKGMKTKLYLLVTLSLDVDFLILDEPTIGLDIAFRKEFFNTILGEFFDESKTILISTHQVEEVESILQDIIFIHEGKIILYEDIETLKDKYNQITVPVEQRNELLSNNPRLVTYSLGNISAIVDSEVKIEGATYKRPQLSDLFLAELGGKNE